MSVYVGDIETDGLLDTLTKVHCLVLQDVDTEQVYSYGPNEIQEGLERMKTATKLIFHNGIKFDFPALEKVYPDFHVDRDRVIDTLVCTRLIWTDLSDTDSGRIAAGKLEPRNRGSHSLAVWGKRLGVLKGDFGQSTDWAEWSPEMQKYCEQDVAVTLKLWAAISAKEYSDTAIDLEHKVAWIVAEQERHGFLFDVAKAEKLLMHLQQDRAKIEADLQTIFDPWYSAVEVKTPKKTVNYKSLDRHSVWEDAPYTVIKQNVFNPNSRMHIANRLTKKYGWEPKDFTPDGKPKVDETVLDSLPYPEAQAIAKSLMIQKRIGQLGEGKNAWLNLVSDDSRIHGSVNTNGAVTGRMTHNYPNVAQTPSVGKPYGKECRELFMVPEGKKLVGVDVSGLELRMLGHFLHKFDEGAYGHEVVNGDIHTVNQKAAGLPSRNQAKTFIYGFLYGAGAAKIGSIVGKGPKEGQKLKHKFLEQTPALAQLINAVTRASKRGYLKGLDGRLLHIRSSHAALNTLLQSAGALVCKQWAVEMDKVLVKRNLKHKCQVVANIHDEHQYECDEDVAELVGELSIQAIKKAGQHFNIKVELDGEAKVGNNWYETH
jgi:DNA polymerase I-like protein with 3'-5' exonuclease and polymerase domains